MTTPLKICGLTRPEDVRFAVDLNIQALGFVFYPASPRYVEPAQARALMQLVPPTIATVGLFVNASPEQMQAVLAIAPVDMLQLHGDESPGQTREIAELTKRPFMKALRIKPDMNAADLVQYESSFRASSSWFRAVLLDTYVDSFGGSGKVFDWSVIPKELAPRVVLSGGLTAHNVAGAVERLRPGAVDVSSGVEQAKGIKDPAKMQAFVDALRLADSTLTGPDHVSRFQFKT
jgi:phosphoribosylanthranilate isomerase